ncbi:MAG: hypothetical protein Q9186_004612 [Xanthomendoza sp. 1 TL-2023]
MADGAHDVHQQLDLSGEPLVPPLRESFQLRDPIPLLEYQDLTIQGKAYNEAYYDYWNSTGDDDGYSAAVIPVTKADKSIDKFDHEYQPLNDIDRQNWEAYDPETYDGAPVGLQIVARKWEEEKVWAIAKILDMALKENKNQDIHRNVT